MSYIDLTEQPYVEVKINDKFYEFRRKYVPAKEATEFTKSLEKIQSDHDDGKTELIDYAKAFISHVCDNVDESIFDKISVYDINPIIKLINRLVTHDREIEEKKSG